MSFVFSPCIHTISLIVLQSSSLTKMNTVYVIVPRPVQHDLGPLHRLGV